MSTNQYALFLNSPYSFYGETISYWRDAVQNTINDIVRAFFRIPSSSRNYFETLKIISDYWSKLDRKLFESEQQFIVTSAKVTDHLLTLLMSEKNMKEPTFNMEMYLLASDTKNLDPYHDNGFIFEKILLEVDEDLLTTYWNIAKLYCSNEFEESPKQIEIIDLLNGKRYVHYPRKSKVTRIAH
jgi:hypothetical protein